MSKQKNLLVGVLFITSLLLAACSRDVSPLEVHLAARDIEWSLTEIEAKAGQSITITVTNEGVLDHNFAIQSLGIEINLAPGESEAVTFDVNEAGTLEFYCSVPGHVDAGMKGTINVAP